MCLCESYRRLSIKLGYTMLTSDMRFLPKMILTSINFIAGRSMSLPGMSAKIKHILLQMNENDVIALEIEFNCLFCSLHILLLRLMVDICQIIGDN